MLLENFSKKDYNLYCSCLFEILTMINNIKEFLCRKNLKKAFTLAEMMIVLLVLSLITAAFLPVITTKSKGGSTDSPWLWSNDRLNAVFNNGNTSGAVIGASNFAGGDAVSRLLINTAVYGNNHILFKQGGTTTGALAVDGRQNVGLGSYTVNNNYGVTAIGNAVNVNGDHAIAIGNNGVTATGDNSIAMGFSSTTGGPSAIAIGDGAHANNDCSVVVGLGNADGYASIAIGNSTYAGSDTSTALNGTAYQYFGVAINGYSDGEYAIAICGNANGYYSIAMGGSSNAQNNYGIAIGASSNSNADLAVALGYNANASGSSAIALGVSTVATPASSIAIGANAVINTGSAGIAIGSGASISAANAVAIGPGASSTVPNQIVLGAAGSSVKVTGQLTVGSLTTGGVALFQNGGVLSSSDRRLKNVGCEFIGGLDKIRELKTYNYTFKGDKTKTPHVGVMAQDLRKVFPDAVYKLDKKGHLGIRQEDMFYAMLNAIKQLDAAVQELVNDFRGLAFGVKMLNYKFMALIKVEQMRSLKIKQLEIQNKALEIRLSKLEKKLNN